jgi:hypothetical protein
MLVRARAAVCQARIRRKNPREIVRLVERYHWRMTLSHDVKADSESISTPEPEILPATDGEIEGSMRNNLDIPATSAGHSCLPRTMTGGLPSFGEKIRARFRAGRRELGVQCTILDLAAHRYALPPRRGKRASGDDPAPHLQRILARTRFSLLTARR